jgi:putative ubiquitin-RnfH superfamily antitoxin RatB of RatAB toxin-antitoxin module
MPTADENSIAIEFAWDELGQVRMARLRVRAGTRLGEALVRAAQQGLLPVQRAQAAAGALAIFGRLRKPDHELHDGDRIDLPGPLRVDPKVARARRAASRSRRGG